tara:strand:+ start:1998 stop:2951 length:954 start_codon:yes stop_codon:yes gene_type:complete
MSARPPSPSLGIIPPEAKALAKRTKFEPGVFTSGDKDATIAALLHRMDQIDKTAQALHTQVKFVHRENEELKKQYKELEKSVAASFSSCAMLPEAPMWNYLDNTPDDKIQVRGLTVFELRQLYDKIKEITGEDPRLQQLAKITNTIPGPGDTLTFKPMQWTAHVQWCAFYYLFFGHIKKRETQHSRARYSSSRIDGASERGLGHVQVEHFECGEAANESVRAAAAEENALGPLPPSVSKQCAKSSGSDSESSRDKSPAVGEKRGRETEQLDDDWMSDGDSEEEDGPIDNSEQHRRDSLDGSSRAGDDAGFDDEYGDW